MRIKIKENGMIKLPSDYLDAIHVKEGDLLECIVYEDKIYLANPKTLF